MAHERCAELRLSRDEITVVSLIVRHHMRPLWLGHGDDLTARAIYRFWRDTGPTGVDICLLSAADFLSTYGPGIDHRRWISHLELLRTLFEGYFNDHGSVIAFPSVVSGEDLIRGLNLVPGPLVGRLLAGVREVQAEGRVTTKDEALEWAKCYLQRCEAE